MLLPTKSRKSRCIAIPALVVLVTVCLFTVPGFSGTYKIYPSADAWVDSYYPNDNHGLDGNVWVGSNAWGAQLFYAYFKFDLSFIPKGERITGGTLYAYCNDYFGLYAWCQLRAVSDTSWIESGPGAITWNNKPEYGSTVISTARGIPNNWRTWSIPAANFPATGLVSFVLTPQYQNASTYEASFNSRENSDNKPYLQVNTTKFGGAGIGLLLSE
jgi:hypothetical protein